MPDNKNIPSGEFFPYNGKIVCFRVYLHASEAEVDRSVLEANGIECYIAAQNHWGTGALTFSEMGCRLMVKEEDKAKALKLLDESRE